MLQEQLNEPVVKTGGVILRATSLDPIKLLEIVSDEDFEEIVAEWAHYFKKVGQEVKIIKFGGPGDKGRDIAVYYSQDRVWDNYQCKHYSTKLSIGELILEIGKICFYSYKKEITIPRKSYIFCSKGMSTKCIDLLLNATSLKDVLISGWKQYCEKKISTQAIPLSQELEEYLKSFDFSIFGPMDSREFIEQYKKTPYFSSRFGVLSKPRPISKNPPQDILNNEFVYIRKILDAYADHLNKNIENAKELNKYSELKKDLEKQRTYFYEAESLEQFSRDIDPEMKQFTSLKEDIYEGIIEKIDEDCINGFERLRKVLNHASLIQVRSNLVSNEASNSDKKGICHHLANEKSEIKWKK